MFVMLEQSNDMLPDYNFLCKNKIKVNVNDTNGPISGGKYKKDRK
jgi:hypothetical protein